MNIQELRSCIEEPVAIQLATVGAGLMPHSVRGFGVPLDEGGTLCVGIG